MPTLADLVAAGPPALDLVRAPYGTGVPLGAVRVAGPGERTVLHRDDVVLAVGGHDLTRLAADAGAARAAAVVVRGDLDPPGDRVALLRVPPGTSWDAVCRLAESVAGPATSDAGGPAGAVVAFAPLGGGDARYAVLPAADPDALRAAAAERLGELDGHCAGIGSVFERTGDAATSRAEADRVVAVLRRRPDLGRVAFVDDVRPHAALAALRAVVHAAEHLRLPQLAALRDHDAAQGTSYLPTLHSYLVTFGDASESARVLGVPVNTFRYRLRRLLTVAGLDLDDTDERLVCELQLAGAVR